MTMLRFVQGEKFDKKKALEVLESRIPEKLEGAEYDPATTSQGVLKLSYIHHFVKPCCGFASAQELVPVLTKLHSPTTKD